MKCKRQTDVYCERVAAFYLKGTNLLMDMI